MSNYKIIFTGPVGSGKTTAIGTLSDIATIRTESIATDETRDRKPQTTVALDYGKINLPDGSSIHLYGTPGQQRFDFMWEILVEGGIGLVLLVDNARTEPMSDMAFFLNAFRNFIHSTGVVVGITRTDLCSRPDIHEYRRELAKLGFQNTPVYEVDAREKQDISLLIETLLCSIDPIIEQS